MTTLNKCLHKKCKTDSTKFEKEFNTTETLINTLNEKIINEKNPRKTLAMMKKLQKTIANIYSSVTSQNTYSCGLINCKKDLDVAMQSGLRSLETLCRDKSCKKTLEHIKTKATKYNIKDISLLFSTMIFEIYKMVIQMEKQKQNKPQ